MKKMLIVHPKNSQMKIISNLLENNKEINEIFTIHYFPSAETEKIVNNNIEIAKYDLIISMTHLNTINKNFVKLNNDQLIFELTHGTWVKRLSKNLEFKNSGIDYIISQCPWSTKNYLMYGFKKENILEYGQPRHEYYKNLDLDEISKEFYKNLNIDTTKKVVLYAPSWIRPQYNIEVNIDSLADKLKEDEVLVILPHINTIKKQNIKYFMSDKIQKMINENKLIIGNGEEKFMKGEYVMLICSKLITDYSSIIFDFANLFPERECEFFFPDLDPKNRKISEIFDIQYKSWGKLKEDFIDRSKPNIKDPNFIYFNEENSNNKILNKILECIKK